ncbi:DNA-3-methyladenine glycosylase [Paenibacillus sp. NEAU-GSW1]|uniref:DNA-3-methyladenine glycosylase family protein n=1 Tax=Paenibacillus sp. NEAU-GSW1 TaxID=2682486 RepID=UPI0012E19DE4|nr:DNA-3-methyladenine glycosylase [Paenibacillus sp. NEAU-GSW1]MUT65721.1 DNA-3-methyladenine glycosylase [Paenibacillus sp. NEAU-GSW1]
MTDNNTEYAIIDHGRGLRITPPEPFSFEQNMNYLSRSLGECMHRIVGSRIRKAIACKDGTTVVVEVSDGRNDGLIVQVLEPRGSLPLPDETLDAVAEYVMDWFDLQTALHPFLRMAERDPLLAGAAREFEGLRIMGIPDFFEAICWGIIGQQINLSYAYTLKRRFVEKYGKSIVCEGELYWLFPKPEDIAALTVHELDALRMTTRKSEYLIGVANLIAEGSLTKEKLLALGDLKKAERTLVDIRGIGPWTANYVLMRCLRMPSAFPIDDVGLHNAIKHVLGSDSKPTKEEIMKLSAGWAGWEAYATFYLWRWLY